MSPVLTVALSITLALQGLAIAIALVRVLRGPRAHDRVLALDFMYVVAMLVLLVLAIRYDSAMYFEAALLMAVFGFVSAAAMAKFLLRGEVIE